MKLNDAAREFIGDGADATLVTLNPDGSPQVSCVWVGLDGEDILTAHLPRNQKVKNVSRDPRVAFSIEGAKLTEHGLKEYLVVRGLATVEEGGAPELLQKLAEVYLGPDVKFPPMDDPPPGYVIRTTPERIGGAGPWVDD
jgi:PPOX class probable F420-dependent enzyme